MHKNLLIPVKIGMLCFIIRFIRGGVHSQSNKKPSPKPVAAVGRGPDSL
ncbi:hypothetical protein [Eubacterium callanderi]|nr:hypothetical protein [Eubacterium callanderi]